MKVLITNGDFLKSLLVLRSVSQFKDTEAHVGAESKFAPALFSKYCKHKLILPNAQKNPAQYIDALVKYTKENKIDVLLPINPFEIELILKNKDLFENFVTIPFVSYELFNKVNDKWQFQSILKELKIDTPKTAKINNLDKLGEVTKSLTYPLVIKYRVSAGSERLKFINSDLEKQYLSLIQTKSKNEDLPIIQEYISGENYGAGAICDKGKVKSVFIYKSLRETHVSYGSSTSRISVYDKELEKKVKLILEHLKWHGVAHFDIIKKGDKYYFLEMNPRFYLSINLTVKSGLNYPYYLCNPKAEILSSYKVGVVCKVFMPDTAVFFKSLFLKDKKKRYSLKELFNINAKEVYFDDIDWKDPLPFIPLFVKGIRGKLL
jgi:predicted ATP-grasp superfamily ATP-dependent carboligase